MSTPYLVEHLAFTKIVNTNMQFTIIMNPSYLIKELPHWSSSFEHPKLNTDILMLILMGKNDFTVLCSSILFFSTCVICNGNVGILSKKDDLSKVHWSMFSHVKLNLDIWYTPNLFLVHCSWFTMLSWTLIFGILLTLSKSNVVSFPC